MTNTTAEVAQANAAKLAGAMYLVSMATGIFGESFVRGSLIVRGDAAQTAQNIMSSERLFRVGMPPTSPFRWSCVDVAFMYC
jgi:hypothetical protein